MRKWLYVIALLLEEWMRQRSQRKRNERHEAIEHDARAEWERRFGSVRQPTESELKQLRDHQAADRRGGTEQRDLD